MNQHIGNAKRCCSGSQEQNFFFRERLTRKTICCNYTSSGYCCCSLYVIIISTNLITILIKDTDVINTRQVFPLNTNLWKNFSYSFHKLFNKIIEFLSSYSLFPEARIKWVI